MPEISHETYLKALGLFTIASEAVKRANEYEAAMSRELGLDPSCASHISDKMWSEKSSVRDFDAALDRDGVTVAARDEGRG